MRQRPQTLRNPLPGIRHEPQTSTHSLTNQTPTPLRHALERPPRALLRHPLRRLPPEIAEPVADAQGERLPRDDGAGFPVRDAAVRGHFGAPEPRQGPETFGRGERHVDEDAFGVGGEELAERFAGGEGHGACDVGAGGW